MKFLLPFFLLSSLLSNSFGQFGLPVNPFKIGEGAKKIVKGSSGIGIQEETAIGGAVAIEIAQNYGGLWRDETATRRVNLIGKSLGRYSDRPDLPFRFGLLNSSTVNGFSAPGGYIFITKAAYEAAQNDDELAGILAHEITHIVRRHALRIISRNETISGIVDVTAGSSSDFAAYDLGVDNVSRTLFKTGYDTGTEFDADRRARDLTSRTGYAADGLLHFLQRFSAGSREGEQLFSTHPPLTERIQRLEKQ
jgi:beta-barrel assembly-enhancing protease